MNTAKIAVVAALVAAGLLNAPEQAHADAAVLDGTYKLFFDGKDATINGESSPQPWATYWYAFRSACLARGCVANGTQVNTDDRTASPAFSHKITLEFTNGQWVTTLSTYRFACGEPSDTWTTQWWLTPESDGTLTGTRVDTPAGSLCGGGPAGVIREPISGTRVGDVSEGVDVAVPT
jgi:serine/threonine-protein kinase